MRNRWPVGRAFAVLLVCASWVSPSLAQTGLEPCGSLSTHYGPYDYRSDRNKLGIVESRHFTPQIEALIRGETSRIEDELDYTLRAFPNHHRALVAMVRLGEKRKTNQPKDLTIDCYFERALRFRSDDAVVRMLYADYLARTRHNDWAAKQLDYVRDTTQDNPLTHYNLGLLYFQIGRFSDAVRQAHRAMALGMERQDLMQKLKAKNQWTDPAPAATDPAASAASANGS